MTSPDVTPGLPLLLPHQMGPEAVAHLTRELLTNADCDTRQHSCDVRCHAARMIQTFSRQLAEARAALFEQDEVPHYRDQCLKAVKRAEASEAALAEARAERDRFKSEGITEDLLGVIEETDKGFFKYKARAEAAESEVTRLSALVGGMPDIETVSAKVHEAWMDAKKAAGVASRQFESGEEMMVPYDALSEQAKELDRGTVRTVFAAIAALVAAPR